MPTAMPPPPSASSSTMAAARRSSSWGPYASAGDFKSNALVIISVLFCAVLLFLAFNSIIRFLLCASCPSPPSADRPDDGEEEEEFEGRGKGEEKTRAAAKAVAFSKDTRLAGAAAECAICLSEFSEGDGIRVLPACNHGFHVRCVEEWLALRRSCPTCRGSALLCDATTNAAAPGSVVEDV